jgi:hypothetical protein
MLRIDTIATHLAEAMRDEAIVRARVAAWRRCATEAAQAEHQRSGSDRWPAADLGTITWEGHSCPPKVVIEKPTQFAEHLAGRRPDAVTARITIPGDPGTVEAVLAAIRDWAGIEADVELVADVHQAEAWIAGHISLRTDPGTGDRQVVEMTESGPVHVPGLGTVRSAPRLVFRPERGVRADWTQLGEQTAEEELADAEIPDAEIVDADEDGTVAAAGDAR